MPVTSAAGAIPAGTVADFAASSAPPGWLKCNGTTVSRTTYAALFLAIGTTYGAGDGSTTFNVPDLRGEFRRGLDDGRGVDSGRTIGSFQDQAFASHGHGVSDPGHAHTVGFGGIGGTNYPQLANGLGQDRGTSGATTGISIQANGGPETRPRNRALLACIKF